ncbi:MAG: hypothetical protein RL579_1108 [Actinomycetota bacterium]|jgi:hypothetical protein
MWLYPAYNLIFQNTGEDWCESNADPQPLKPDYLILKESTTRRGLRGFSQKTLQICRSLIIQFLNIKGTTFLLVSW